MGYTVGHFDGPVSAPDVSLYIRVKRVKARPPVAGVLTCIQILSPGHVPVLPYYRPANNTRNEVVASIHRFGRHMPPMSALIRDHFSMYVKAFLVEFITPLKDGDVKHVKQWIDECNQSGHRKDYFRRLRADLQCATLGEVCAVQSFIKSEGYVPSDGKFTKHARAINSYSDISKVILGPIISACDKALFRSKFLSKFFVKYEDPRKWVSRVRNTFGDLPVYSSDFSSFESHHRGALADAVYLWLMHSVRNLTGVRLMRDIIARMVRGRNYIKFTGIDVEVDQTLMSGALWTSSSNGFLNLLLNSYMAARTRVGLSISDMITYVRSEFRGLFEGDDGLVEDVGISPDLPGLLGLNLEITPHSHCSTAGFCSLYFSIESDQIIREPFEFMRKFCSMPAKYHSLSHPKKMSLMRVKTKSHLDTLSACPVIGEFLANVDKFTAPYDMSYGISQLDSYEYEKFRWCANRLKRGGDAVEVSSRVAMERQFGIRVELQLCLEAQIRATRGSPTFVLDVRPCLDDLYYVQNFYSNTLEWVAPPLRFPKPVIERVMERGELGRHRMRPSSDRRLLSFPRMTAAELGVVDNSGHST